MSIIKIRPWNWLAREENHAQAAHPAHAGNSLSLSPWGLRREIDKLFDDTFRNLARPLGNEFTEGVFAPKIDISGSATEYTVSVELPGIEEKDIELEVYEDVLSVKAQREHESKSEGEDGKKDYYRIERHYGMFQRALRLPEDADAANIAANYKNGVLHISIARKTPQKNEARKITIAS
jgi:HSP20 family protein